MTGYSQFWEPRVIEPISDDQFELATTLLTLMTKRMCHIFYPRVFEDYYMASDAVRSSYSNNNQLYSRKDALICSEFVSAFSIVCSCLYRWNLVTFVEDPNKAYFKLNQNADEISNSIQASGANMQLYGYAIAAFFELDFQYAWHEPTRIGQLKFTNSIVEQFKRVGLIDETKGKLIWSNCIKPYLINGYPVSYEIEDEDFENPIREEAEDFFRRIVS